MMIIFAFLLSFLDVQRPRIIYIDTPNRTIDKIPLTNFQVDVEVSGTAAQANYTLKYQNTDNNTLVEAKLKFPFDTDVTVSDVSLHYKNKTIIGQLMKHSHAKIIYDNEKQDKNVAMLVQRVGDYISIDLAGIEPNETFTAKISAYSVLDLKFDYKKETFFTRYIFPASMVPRYSPSVQTNDKRDNSNEDPYLQSQVNYTFDFTLKTTSGQISTESILNMKEATRGKIEYNDTTFSYSGEVPDDVNLDIITKSPKSTIEMTIERFENSTVTEISIPGSVLLSHRKNYNYEKVKSDEKKSYVFLIDRSGSMYGDGIKKAGAALELFLHSIPSNSVFEIVGFGSEYKPLFNKLVDYNDDTLKVAVNYAKSVDADMGGTEMLEPLKYILEKRPDYLIFLTDGAVVNTNEVKSFCSKFSTQISTIAIGNYAANDLLKSIASQTMGTYEHVDFTNQIEGAVIRSLSAMKNGFCVSSIKTNCGVIYQSFPVIVLPYTSVPLRFFNKNGFSTEKVIIELTFLDFLTKDNFTFTIRQDDPSIIVNKVDGKKLHCVALLKAINDRVIAKGEDEIEQSMRLGLMTKQTSFILVDKRSSSEKEKIKMESIEIPVKMHEQYFHASGAGGFQAFFATPLPHMPRMERSSKRRLLYGAKSGIPSRVMNKVPVDLSFEAGSNSWPLQQDDQQELDVSSSKETSKKRGDFCASLSSLQKASGKWELDQVLDALNVKLNDSDAAEWLNKNDGREELLAVLFAVNHLNSKCGDSYKLVVEKGNKYIENKFSQQLIQSALKVVDKYKKN